MATNRLEVSLRIRNSLADEWEVRNPTLAEGEFGLETDTLLLKIGDGLRDWAHLPYLNQIDTEFLKKEADGTLTFSDSFQTIIQNLLAAAGEGQFVIDTDPTNPTDPVNLRYLEWAIAHAGHLKREVVLSLPTESIDENTLYMVLAQSGDHYEEYMYINGAWDMVGTTGDGGSSGGYTLPVATRARLGGVKASGDPDKIDVTQEGFMTINDVSTSKLYIPTGDVLIIAGGGA